jgi:hypothetical protein
MSDPIDITQYLTRRRATSADDPFDKLVLALRVPPLDTLISALAAAREIYELASIAAELSRIVASARFRP